MVVRLPATLYRHCPPADHGDRPIADIRGVVVHVTDGSTLAGAESWFHDPRAGGVGAHAIIGVTDCVQLIGLDHLAWHAAGANQHYVGIEHVGIANTSRDYWVRRRTQRKIGANRAAWILWRFRLGPPQRHHNIFAHNEFPAGGHTCPGPFWPWGLYMAAVQRAYTHLEKSNGKTWST